jgi:anaerobic carbon-monoxide dehydrogenase iron sulfur subunit
MPERERRRLTIRELGTPPAPSRREFLKKVALGSGSLLIGGRFLVRQVWAATEGEKTVYSMVVVDFNKCAGCRTCETACSSFNHKAIVDGKELPGLGNPSLSNIRVQPFNPDVDIPVMCLMCEDAPCIAACPVEPDAKTGRRALYRDGKLPVLHNDPGRCIACGSCAEACRTKRVGAIIPNSETNRPERMCTLCGGEPQCVKACPYGALSHVVEGANGRHYGIAPAEAAKALAKLWYGQE